MKKKKKRPNWDKIEAYINALGVRSPRQVKKLRVVRTFLSKNRFVQYDLHKAPYELTLQQFISANAKEVLDNINYSSAREAQFLLRSRYIGIIIKAVQEDIDGVHPEGLELIRFRTEYMDVVKRYCRARRIVLD